MSQTFAIEGMHCGACVSRVQKALEAVPGLAVSEVSVGSATVDLSTAKREDAVAAINKTGFRVKDGWKQ